MNVNRKIGTLQLILAALCGIVLGIHRMSAESGKQMAIVCAAAAAVLLAVSVFSARLAGKYEQKAQDGKAKWALLALSGILFFPTAMLFFLRMDASAVFSMITALFCAVCGIATLLRLRSRDSGKTAACLSLIPVFFLCFILLSFYRSNGDNPHLEQFGYEIIAVMAVLAGVYFASAGKFEKPRHALRCFFALFGTALTVQEFVLFFRNSELLMHIPGMNTGMLLLLLTCLPLLMGSILCPPVQEVQPAEKAEDQAPASSEN